MAHVIEWLKYWYRGLMDYNDKEEEKVKEKIEKETEKRKRRKRKRKSSYVYIGNGTDGWCNRVIKKLIHKPHGFQRQKRRKGRRRRKKGKKKKEKGKKKKLIRSFCTVTSSTVGVEWIVKEKLPGGNPPKRWLEEK